MKQHNRPKLPKKEFGAFSVQDREDYGHIVPWCQKYVRPTEGQWAGELLQLSRSPWLIKPLLSFERYDVEETTILKSTQGAGTFCGEIEVGFHCTHRPEPALFQAVQKEKARQQADRTIKKITRLPTVAPFLALDQVMQIGGEYPDWNLLFQAANDSNAQSTTAGVQWNDEVWQYPTGMMQQLRNRTDQLPFKKITNITSAGDSHSDAMAAFNRGTQEEFFVRCLGCGELFWTLFGRRAKEVYGQHVIIWTKDSGPVETECPHCAHKHEDSREVKEEMSTGGDYQAQNKNPTEYCTSFRWNAFVPSWVRNADLRNRYIAALDDIREGKGSENMKVFSITRLVEPIEEIAPDVGKMHVTGDYKLSIQPQPWSDVVPVAEPWVRDGKLVPELVRFMTVDVGIDHFWIVIRAVDPFYRTRLISAMRLRTWEQVYQMSRFFGVQPSQVAVDCGTMTKKLQKVYFHCALFGFWGFEGADEDKGFPWRFKEIQQNEDGEDVVVEIDRKRPYSQVIERDAMVDDEVKTFRVVRFSNWLAKNRLVDLRDGRAGYWGVPSNHQLIPELPSDRVTYNSEYHHQMHGEIIEEEMHKRTRKMRFIWKRIHAQHYWDCETMQTIWMSMLLDDPNIEQKRAPLLAAL